MIGSSFASISQNEYIDYFNDGIVNTSKYESINSNIIENVNGMEIQPIGALEGGVRIKPNIPNVGLNFTNQNVASYYELVIRPDFTNINDNARINVIGSEGETIESYLISNIDKKIYYFNRNKEGELETELFGSFTAGNDITIQAKRTYSWWPPVCKGDRCDYGIDISDLLIFARWRIGKVASSIQSPPSNSGVINPERINIESTNKFTIAKFIIRDFIPQLEHPLLGLKTSSVYYKNNSGASTSLILADGFF